MILTIKRPFFRGLRLVRCMLYIFSKEDGIFVISKIPSISTPEGKSSIYKESTNTWLVLDSLEDYIGLDYRRYMCEDFTTNGIKRYIAEYQTEEQETKERNYT